MKKMLMIIALSMVFLSACQVGLGEEVEITSVEETEKYELLSLSFENYKSTHNYTDEDYQSMIDFQKRMNEITLNSGFTFNEEYNIYYKDNVLIKYSDTSTAITVTANNFGITDNNVKVSSGTWNYIFNGGLATITDPGIYVFSAEGHTIKLNL